MKYTKLIADFKLKAKEKGFTDEEIDEAVKNAPYDLNEASVKYCFDNFLECPKPEL